MLVALPVLALAGWWLAPRAAQLALDRAFVELHRKYQLVGTSSPVSWSADGAGFSLRDLRVASEAGAPLGQVDAVAIVLAPGWLPLRLEARGLRIRNTAWAAYGAAAVSLHHALWAGVRRQHDNLRGGALRFVIRDASVEVPGGAIRIRDATGELIAPDATHAQISLFGDVSFDPTQASRCGEPVGGTTAARLSVTTYQDSAGLSLEVGIPPASGGSAASSAIVATQTVAAPGWSDVIDARRRWRKHQQTKAGDAIVCLLGG